MDATTLTGVTLYQVMFAYSGANKIRDFDTKVDTLVAKVRQRTQLDLPRPLASLGMAGVILLEIVGSLVLILYAARALFSDTPPSRTWKLMARCTLVLMILFVVTATLLYHPPTKRVIPFLSNVTTASGFILMWQALRL